LLYKLYICKNLEIPELSRNFIEIAYEFQSDLDKLTFFSEQFSESVKNYFNFERDPGTQLALDKMKFCKDFELSGHLDSVRDVISLS